MIDVSVAMERYKFLGLEFLTWLWYCTENQRGVLLDQNDAPVDLNIGDKIVLVNTITTGSECVTIKGDDANLAEAMVALKKGACVSEISFVLKDADFEWFFTVKADSFNISACKTPPGAAMQNDEEFEGAVLEKIFLIEKISFLFESLYARFLSNRLSADWQDKTIPAVRQWINP